MKGNNENIKQLRVLSQIICDSPIQEELNDLIDKLKTILVQTKNNVLNSKSTINKLKCYEEFYNNINIILINKEL